MARELQKIVVMGLGYIGLPTASMLATKGHQVLGVDVNATHHASARSGRVRGVATAIHLGRSATTHEVVISHEDTGKRLCTVRITNFLKDVRKP